MPYKYFECPDDGRKVTIERCLKDCVKEERCLSLPTLRMIAQQREWTGKPSVTQLLKGTREAYLMIVNDDLVMNPLKQLFRILGTKGHAVLEPYADNELSEEKLVSEIVTGTFDLYDPESKILYDYKTWGSYKVAAALGLKVVKVDTGEVYVSGAKKGQPKMKKQIVKGEPDMKDAELQLNYYRIMLEELGFPVEKMAIEAIVRDGGTYIAQSRGIDKNGYVIPVRRIPDKDVIAYFKTKRDQLLNALEKNIVPDFCTAEECWNDRKCKNYCDVSKHCGKLEG